MRAYLCEWETYADAAGPNNRRPIMPLTPPADWYRGVSRPWWSASVISDTHALVITAMSIDPATGLEVNPTVPLGLGRTPLGDTDKVPLGSAVKALSAASGTVADFPAGEVLGDTILRVLKRAGLRPEKLDGQLRARYGGRIIASRPDAVIDEVRDAQPAGPRLARVVTP